MMPKHTLAYHFNRDHYLAEKEAILLHVGTGQHVVLTYILAHKPMISSRICDCLVSVRAATMATHAWTKLSWSIVEIACYKPFRSCHVCFK